MYDQKHVASGGRVSYEAFQEGRLDGEKALTPDANAGEAAVPLISPDALVVARDRTNGVRLANENEWQQISPNAEQPFNYGNTEMMVQDGPRDGFALQKKGNREGRQTGFRRIRGGGSANVDTNGADIPRVKRFDVNTGLPTVGSTFDAKTGKPVPTEPASIWLPGLTNGGADAASRRTGEPLDTESRVNLNPGSPNIDMIARLRTNNDEHQTNTVLANGHADRSADYDEPTPTCWGAISCGSRPTSGRGPTDDAEYQRVFAENVRSLERLNWRQQHPILGRFTPKYFIPHK